MNDTQISKALALAIGWTPQQIGLDPTESNVYVNVSANPVWRKEWRSFDYRDWNVIGPIAERYGAFPAVKCDGNFKRNKAQGYPTATGWELFMCDYPRSTEQNGKWLHYEADTPQRAIALAVIGAKK